MKKNRVLGCLVGIVVFLAIIFFAALFFGEDEKDTPTTKESTTVSLEDDSDALKKSLIDFSNFTDSYLQLPDNKKANSWENVRGSDIHWQGTLIEIGNNRLYFIRNDNMKTV